MQMAYLGKTISNTWHNPRIKFLNLQPKAFSFQCMTELTTNKKKKKKRVLKINREEKQTSPEKTE